MIKCPSCGHENVPGTQFCEGCGEDLPQDNGAVAAPAATFGFVPAPHGLTIWPARHDTDGFFVAVLRRR